MRRRLVQATCNYHASSLQTATHCQGIEPCPCNKLHCHIIKSSTWDSVKPQSSRVAPETDWRLRQAAQASCGARSAQLYPGGRPPVRAASQPAVCRSHLAASSSPLTLPAAAF